MMNTMKLPVGIDDFRKLRESDFYYVDKTRLIEQILQSWSEVTLFTRPRRFGKTLNMSMLRSFFEKGTDKALFEGLYISGNKELCDEHMGKYPVIFLSFKGVDGLDFTTARRMLCAILKDELDRHYYLKNSDVLTDEDRTLFTKMLHGQDDNIEDSIRMLSKLLYKHYGQKVVILIDEYDVPLDKAFQNGYYKEMASLIRGLFSPALKTNDFLQFAVLTGCLRVSKESIFTGLNNLKVDSVLRTEYGDSFGFTESEVEAMLTYYDLAAELPEVKRWYDGYLFNDIEIYNPWSIINYAYDRSHKITQFTLPYWSNSSSNSIIREMVGEADADAKHDLETLINGGTIEKQVHEEITYGDIHQSQDNLWNFLFFTGYLKKVGERKEGNNLKLEMKIPNIEIATIYENSISYWFEQRIKQTDRSPLKHALETGDCEAAEDFINRQLADTISYYDYAENFYHGFMAGLLVNIGGYRVKSNRESGNGRPDIVMTELKFRGRAMILELKVSETINGMEKKCEEGLDQIEKGNYAQPLTDDGYQPILKYAVCFFKKGCMVRKKK